MIKSFLKSLKEQGFRQKDIAEKSGLAHISIRHLSAGRNLDLETVIKLADAFGVTIDEVLGRGK